MPETKDQETDGAVEGSEGVDKGTDVEDKVEDEGEVDVEAILKSPEVTQRIEQEVAKRVTPVQEELNRLRDVATSDTTEEDAEVFGSDWQPGSYGELGNEILKKAEERVIAKLTDLQQKAQSERDEINKKFDSQISELKSGGEDISEEVEKEVFGLMSEYGIVDFKKGYDVYKKVEQAQKAGVKEGEKSGVQKKAASKVGSSRGGKAVGKKAEKVYQPGRTLDDVVMDRLGELSS